VSRHPAGSIVVVDWRGGALPQEPTRLRPAVVVEDHELFPEQYPNTIVVPLTRDEGLAHKTFAEKIEPAPGNGAEVTCWALAHHVTSVSLRRITATPSRVTDDQLASIRRRITLAVGDCPADDPRPGSSQAVPEEGPGQARLRDSRPRRRSFTVSGRTLAAAGPVFVPVADGGGPPDTCGSDTPVGCGHLPAGAV
jgi:mRNA interferase MazF